MAALAGWTAGVAALIQGRMAEAVASFDAARAGLAQLSLADAAAQTQVPKIMALSMLGRHDEAADCAERTQRELRDLGNLAAAARVSQNLGSLHLRRDAYAQAASHYREAAVLFARLRQTEQSVLADCGLGDALTALGKFDEALLIYARVRMRARNSGLERLLAHVDGAEASIELARGRFREALAGFDAACRRYGALDLPQYLAVAENQLAEAYLELRLLPEALALFDAAVAKFAALDQPDEQAWALAQRGRAQALLGRPGADESFAQAAIVFDAQGNEVASALVALARAELAGAQGRHDDAATWSEQAGGRLAQAGQADGAARAELLRAQADLARGHLRQAAAGFASVLARALELQQVSLQVRSRSGQGQVALALGQRDEAVQHFEAAIELFEVQRQALPGDELRSAFLADQLRPFHELLRLALEGGDAAAVLRQLERFRARSLDLRLNEAAAGAAAAGEEQQALRQRLNWLHRRVQQLQDEGQASAALETELRQTEHALLEQARRQRLAAPATMAGGDSALPLAELQQALRPGEAVVAFGSVGELLFACVVDDQGVRLCRHDTPWPAVQDAVRAVRFQMESLRPGAGAVQRHQEVLAQRARSRLAQAHELLWAPLLPALAGCRRVLVVPHGALGALPFAALAPSGGGPLGQQLELAVVPSVRAALRGLRHGVAAPHRVVALAESSRLAHAQAEAQAVAALFAHARLLCGADATVAALQAAAPQADVLHLACHAQFRSDNPRFSALQLLDGPLSLDLAEGLGLPGSTVVLSACETGLADHAGGDEMVGLVRAFLVGGAARVVASLWPVDDAVTAAFMGHFHRSRLAGLGPAQALQQAQAAIASTHPHPGLWAAFTLYGGW